MKYLNKFTAFLLLLWIAVWRLVGMLVAPIIVGLIIGTTIVPVRRFTTQ